MSRRAKHEELAGVLRARIDSGEYSSELPSESNLMEEFGYSRSTVRQAFLNLEAEGRVAARGGSRRRVTQQQRMHWPMTSWERMHTEDADAWAVAVRQQGGEPTTEVTVLIETAGDDIAAALQIEPGSDVVLRRRVRFVDGRPHQLADSYFPFWLAERHPVFLRPGDLAAPGGLLASVGEKQTRFRDELTARMPAPEEAELLQSGRGVPLLIHTRTGYNGDGVALRHMVTRMSADRVSVSYELVP